MEDGRVLRGHLGVADPAAGGHQVDLAGSDHRVVVPGVVVGDVAREQPAHRLETGVRMRRHIHAPGGRDVVGAEVVDKAPGPDEGPLALRQRPLDGHRPRAAERDVAGGDDLDRRASGLGPVGSASRLALDLPGIELDVAHRAPSARATTACPAYLAAMTRPYRRDGVPGPPPLSWWAGDPVCRRVARYRRAPPPPACPGCRRD